MGLVSLCMTGSINMFGMFGMCGVVGLFVYVL